MSAFVLVKVKTESANSSHKSSNFKSFKSSLTIEFTYDINYNKYITNLLVSSDHFQMNNKSKVIRVLFHIENITNVNILHRKVINSYPLLGGICMVESVF